MGQAGDAPVSRIQVPAGTRIAASGYLTIRCDGSRPASSDGHGELNVGQSLDGDSGGLYLFDTANRLVEFVEYGFQLEDGAVGLYVDYASRP